MRYWRRRPTKEERMLKEALEKHGVKVLSQVRDGHKCIDLAIPAARINIEVDGKQHLTNSHQILSDLQRSHYSDVLGFETVRIPNAYIYSDLEKIAKALAEAATVRERHILQGLAR